MISYQTFLSQTTTIQQSRELQRLVVDDELAFLHYSFTDNIAENIQRTEQELQRQQLALQEQLSYLFT